MYYVVYLQQLLFHLSQLNPCRPTIRLRKNQNARSATATAEAQEKILCVDSFNATLANLKTSKTNQFIEVPIDVLSKTKVNYNFSKKKCYVNGLEDTIKTSYIPGYSFAENGKELLYKSITVQSNLSSLTSLNLNTLLCLQHFQS